MSTKRLLISWVATRGDFIQVDGAVEINPEGPSMQFHRVFWGQVYEEHLLLSNRSNCPKAKFLHEQLSSLYPERHIRLQDLEIVEVINLEEVLPKVQNLLLRYKERKIDIHFSTGTPVMQLAWFLSHHHLGLDSRLFQTIRAKESRSGQPEILFFKYEKDSVARALIVHQQQRLLASSAAKKGSGAQDFYEEEDYAIGSDSLKPVYQMALRIAQAGQGNALIYGESGTGKEHLARWMHRHSPRKTKAFFTLNCAALDDQLLESRLFGYCKGAFTGAQEDRKGFFQEAEKGTLFLDEIGDISPYMQQSLLRVLENRQISPIGSGKSIDVDVWVIAASNKRLLKLCEAGKFRWDLYYRLFSLELELPPLRARSKNDKNKLIELLLENARRALGRKQRLKLSQELLHFLLSYPFRGNVRELKHLIERFYILCDTVADMSDLPKQYLDIEQEKIQGQQELDASTIVSIRQVCEHYAIEALKYFDYNQTQTAKALGITVNTLKRYIQTEKQ